MENLVSDYKCFRARGLPVGAFGESYLIVSTVVETLQRLWEWFFLSKRFDPGLLMSSYCYKESAGVLDEHPIDMDYLLEEAKEDACTQIFDKFEKLAEEKAKPQGFYPDFMDTLEKPDNGQKECLCKRENTAPSSSEGQLSKSISEVSVVPGAPEIWVLRPIC